MKDLSNEFVIHQNSNGIEYLQFKKLLEYPEIEHCYTMRDSEMNFRIYENDRILQASYDKICSVLEFCRENIVKPHQTHTDKVEVVQNSKEQFSEVDGLITKQKQIPLCTTSADCTALLFYDPVKHAIGDVHSGWRGTVQKIGQKAVQKMVEEYSCNPEDIICCICPHIRKCHFEVGEEVAKLFYDNFAYMDDTQKIIVKSDDNKVSKIGNLDKYFKELENTVGKGNELDEKFVRNEPKYYIDTTMINYKMLQDVGLKIENIIDSGICTVCEKERFHSYRGDKEVSGRNGAMIMLR